MTTELTSLGTLMMMIQLMAEAWHTYLDLIPKGQNITEATSEKRTGKCQTRIKHHEWSKNFPSLWRLQFPAGTNMPIPSQGVCFNHHGAPIEPSALGMASESLSTHNHLFRAVKKPIQVRASQALQSKSPSLQEPAATVNNTDNTLRLSLRSLRPALEKKKRQPATETIFWNRAAVVAQCRVSLFMVLYHHSLPNSQVLTLRRSKRSSSGCLFSMNS